MKKFLRIIAMALALFAVLGALSGCDLFGGNETPPPEVDLDDLVGTWVSERDGGTIRYTFTKDMRYTKDESGPSVSASTSIGTYTLEDNILVTKSNLGGERTHEISEFDGERMVWGKGAVTTEYIKQKKK